MKLILSDKKLQLDLNENIGAEIVDLSSMKIAGCVGCFGCWTKTPGKCVVRDDAVKVYPLIAKSDEVIYVSRVKYGGYDTVMKTMMERTLPIMQAFITLVEDETHHAQRDVARKKATIIGYGDLDDEEKELFRELIARNARNMNFESYSVIFADEERLEELVEKEAEKWAE